MSRELLERLRWSRKRRLPALMQSDASEAGLICLAMVASFHGRKLDLNTLRHEHAVSLKGTSSAGLARIADRLSLAARSVQVAPGELTKLRAPAILIWSRGHYVVLREVRRGIATLHDPAVGVRRVAVATLGERNLTALELTPTPGFTIGDERRRLTLASFWSEIVGLRGYLVQLFVLSLLLQVVSLLSPFYTQLVIDESLVRRDPTLLDLLAICFLGVTVLQSALTWFRSWALLYLGNVLALQMQTNLVRHLLFLPLSFFAKRHVGDVMSRYGSMSAVQGFLTNGLLMAVADTFMLVSTFGALLLYSPLLTAVACLLLVVYAGTRALRYRAQRTLSAEALVAGADNTSHLIETIRNMTTIKMFGFELERLNLWSNRNVDVTNAGIRLARMNLGFTVFNKLVFNTGTVLVVYLGARLVLEGSFTTGMLVAFLAYQTHFLNAGADLVDQINAYKLLGVSLDRLGDIALGRTEEPRDADASTPLPASGGALAVTDLTFRYSPSDPQVLRGVSLQVQPGECVAIMGPSGAGKSTLIRLMLGLEKAESGTVSFAGVELARLGLWRYRQLVAAVTQDDRLFSGTIAENITMFAAGRDSEHMIDCARRACIHDAIVDMPLGYQTLVGDMGDVLSAGERQRLMLARALYKRPRVIFLDEVTSNLDRELDSRINAMLASLAISRVIVTHRQTVLTYADRVYILRDGKLEQPAHDKGVSSIQAAAS